MGQIHKQAKSCPWACPCRRVQRQQQLGKLWSDILLAVAAHEPPHNAHKTCLGLLVHVCCPKQMLLLPSELHSSRCCMH